MKPTSASFIHFTRLDGYRWTWPHFKPSEMADSQSGELLVVPAFMDWLEDVRCLYDKPMVITSGYRTPQHQRKISGRATGAHVDGMAVDVQVSGVDAEHLERVAVGRGVLGRGIFQAGPHAGRYLHLDMWTNAPDGQRPMLWSY